MPEGPTEPVELGRRTPAVRRQLSLKWLLVLSFLALGIVLVIGYSWLSAQWFVRGMDSIVASNMEQAALSYLDAVPTSQREATRSFSGYEIVSNWGQMPVEIRDAFEQAPEGLGVLHKKDESGWLQPPEIVHFSMRLDVQGQHLYVGQRVTPASASRLVGRNLAKSMRMLLAISAAIALTLGAIVWLLMRRVARPVAALGRWTRALGPETLQDSPPDFSYPELNALAELIRTSLSSVQAALDREHRFLRHASHELRTPISVIRSNLELLRRLYEHAGSGLDPRELQAIGRIGRASLNMQHLTETLLWLGRDSAETPASRPVRIDTLVRQLADDMRYLLKDKHVAVELATRPCELVVPEVMARIVLGNLIRNAFQHTWTGEIRIRQQGGVIEIVNIDDEKSDHETGRGFGLGLQLTAQLTARLGWDYANEARPHGHSVRLDCSSTGL